jgi:hypothetical protein
MKLKAEGNSRTRYSLLIYVIQNNKDIVFFEALLQDIISRTKYVVTSLNCLSSMFLFLNVKVIPQQAEVVQTVRGRLRRRSFLTFGPTSVVGR